MANPTLFKSDNGTTVNNAGGLAYKSTHEQSLALYATTGTLNNTCYSTARCQLDEVLSICNKCSPEFIAKVAVYSRRTHMADMPAMLLAYLNATKPEIIRKVFSRVLDNGKMISKFIQIIRSNATGRRTISKSAKYCIRKWFANRSAESLIFDSVGKQGDVRFKDVIKLCRPTPVDHRQSAMFAWICGAEFQDGNLIQEVILPKRLGYKKHKRVYAIDDIPRNLRMLNTFKMEQEAPLPSVPMEMLTSLKLSDTQWGELAKKMSWQQLRQNIETLSRHGVFDNPQIVSHVCQKLRDIEEIKKARAVPYQLLVAFLNTGAVPESIGMGLHYFNAVSAYEKSKDNTVSKIPSDIRLSLEFAMEELIKNVPTIPGVVYVCPDTSGSMTWPITGVQSYDFRRVPTTKVRCIDVAGLITASIVRHNPMSEVLPFNTKVNKIELSPMDSVMRNSQRFTKLGGGGTACSAPIAHLNEREANGDVIILISDYESWSDSHSENRRTKMMEEWSKFKKRNPQAKLVCIDLVPRTNSQVKNDPDILNVGGWSDHLFDIISLFVSGQLMNVVDYINDISLETADG